MNGDGISTLAQAPLIATQVSPQEEGVTWEEWTAESQPGFFWRVLHTRARCEKLVASSLTERGIRHYLPLVTSKRRYGRRTLSFLKPLFPGYLFLFGNAAATYAALETNKVANVLEVPDQVQLCQELKQISHAIESGETVELYPALRRGRACRVVGGALKGLEGVVDRRGRRGRIYIAATVLGQSAVLDVDVALLEPIL